MIFRRYQQFYDLTKLLKRNKLKAPEIPEKKMKNFGSLFKLEKGDVENRLEIFIKYIEQLVGDKDAMSKEFVKKFFTPNQLGDVKPN